MSDKPQKVIPPKPGKPRTRQHRGDGTVYFDHARNRWIGAITINGARRKVSALNEQDCRIELRKLVAAKTTGAPQPNKRTTVADAVQLFLERGVPERTRGGQPLSPSTLTAYEWTGKTICTDPIGKKALVDLEVEDVEAMLTRLAKRKRKPLSAASLRKVRGTLQRSIEFARRRKLVTWNAAKPATIKVPTTTTIRERRSLSPAEARTLFEACRVERLGAMYVLQLFVGLRPGEASGLWWEDLDESTLNVTRGVRLTAGRAEIVDDLKTASSKRTVQLPGEVVDRLADHRKAQAAERLAATTWLDKRLMFASPRGNVLSPPNVRRDLARICAEHGLPVVAPNELRHTCASLLSNDGVSNEHLKDLLGHTTTRMVDQTYRHRLRPVVDIAAQVDWTAILGPT